MSIHTVVVEGVEEMPEIGDVLYKAVVVHIEQMEDDSRISVVIRVIIPVITIPARGEFVLIYLLISLTRNILSKISINCTECLQNIGLKRYYRGECNNTLDCKNFLYGNLRKQKNIVERDAGERFHCLSEFLADALISKMFFLYA